MQESARLQERGPSVIGPERFPRPVPSRKNRITPSVETGTSHKNGPSRFPEVHHPIAVLLPESFRGGCSFGGLKNETLSREGSCGGHPRSASGGRGCCEAS